MARSGALRSDGTSSERVAGWAFFMFTLFQVPTWIMDTTSTREGYALLSPLQVTAAHMANTAPATRPYMTAALIPGAWTRDALAPYMRCMYKSNWRGPCTLEKGRLTNYFYVEGMAALPALQRLVKSSDLKGQQTTIAFGSAMITVSAMFALFYSVKTAVVGFGLLTYGVLQSGGTPLPPAIMMAFLCLYSGFKLDSFMNGGGQAQAADSAGTPAAKATPRKNPYESGGGSGSGNEKKANKTPGGAKKQRA